MLDIQHEPEMIEIGKQTLPLGDVLRAAHGLKKLEKFSPKTFNALCVHAGNEATYPFEDIGEKFCFPAQIVDANKVPLKATQAVVKSCQRLLNGGVMLSSIMEHPQIAPYLTPPHYFDGGKDDTAKTAQTLAKLTKHYTKLNAIRLRMQEVMEEFDIHFTNIPSSPNPNYLTIPANGGMAAALDVNGELTGFATPLGKWGMNYDTLNREYSDQQFADANKVIFKEFDMTKISEDPQKGSLWAIGQDAKGDTLPQPMVAHLEGGCVDSPDISGLRYNNMHALWVQIAKDMKR